MCFSLNACFSSCVVREHSMSSMFFVGSQIYIKLNKKTTYNRNQKIGALKASTSCGGPAGEVVVAH